jgi:adhesin transport system outer membrane protein
MQPWAKLKLLSVGLITCLGAGSALADNLQQAVDQTIATHPQVLSTESLQDAASADIQQQKGAYYPSFDVTAGYGKQTSDNPATRASTTLSSPITLTRQESHFLLQQLLFDGGNVSNRVAKSKADFQTTTYQVYEAQEALGYDAALAYLTVMQDRELLKIARLNVTAHEDMYQKIARRVQAGAGKKSDLDLAESRLALAKSNYIQTQGQLEDDEATYVKVIGSAPSAYLEMPPQPQNIPLTLSQAQQLAVQLNPTLAASKSQVASNVAAVGVAKSAYFPTVTLDLSASYSDSLDGVPGYNNDRQALVRMNYNLFRGGSDKAAVSAARYRVISAEQDSQKLQRDIMETVAFAWVGMQTSIRRIPELQVHSTQSYNVWQAYIKQFQLGQRTLFDLLNSQSEYYDAQSALVQAQYQERIDRYQLLAAIGELVSTVKNPDFAREPTTISYPKSTIKKIKITLPSSPDSGAAATPANGASASWTYPAENANATAPKVNSGNVIAIPSLEVPASLKGQQNNINKNTLPSTPSSVVPAVPDINVPKPVPTNTPSAPNPPAKNSSGSGAPTLLMKNEHPPSVAPTNKVASYHLQLIASQQKSDIERYIQKYHLTANNTSINEHMVKGKNWFALSYGNYPTEKTAQLAKNDLTKQLHGAHPLIIKNS